IWNIQLIAFDNYLSGKVVKDLMTTVVHPQHLGCGEVVVQRRRRHVEQSFFVTECHTSVTVRCACDISQFVRFVVVKEHVFRTATCVAESPANVETERYSVNHCTAVAPRPTVFKGPHAPSPIQQSESVCHLDGKISEPHISIGNKTIFLVIEIKLPSFLKGN